jgi:hypothetical protein
MVCVIMRRPAVADLGAQERRATGRSIVDESLGVIVRVGRELLGFKTLGYGFI